MSFKSKNISTPNQFIPKRSFAAGANQFDHLGTVVGYEHSSDGHGLILVKEDPIFDNDEGRLISARISPESVSNVRAAAHGDVGSEKFRGNVIDQKMEAGIPVGHRVVLERCKVIGKTKVNDEDRLQMECQYISHMTSLNPDKSIRALFTMEVSRKNPQRVGTIQVWDEQAYGENEFDEIRQQLDEVYQAFMDGDKYVTNRGVQFRAVIPNGTNDKNEPIYQVVDTTAPFEWERAERDEAGNIIKDGCPLNSEVFDETLEAYKHYLLVSEDDDRGLPPKLDPKLHDQVQVEVMAYDNFIAATKGTRMNISSERHPFYQLTHTKTRGAIGDSEDFNMGKNWAVSGILEFTDDKLERTAEGPVEIEMNIVKRAFVNNPRGNLHSFVRTSEGHKARVHPDLNRIKDDSYGAPQRPSAPAAPQAPQQGQGSASMAPPGGPAAQPTGFSGGFDDDDDDQDLFGLFGDDSSDSNDDDNDSLNAAPEFEAEDSNESEADNDADNEKEDQVSASSEESTPASSSVSKRTASSSRRRRTRHRPE